jgi:hypothetical protein
MRGLFIILLLSFQGILGQVGINTTDPQEAIHLAGSTGTLRVESLNAANNIYNPGDLDGDGNMDDNTVPLYVDENGDFILQLQVLENSGSEDWIVPTFNSVVQLEASNSTGCVDVVIETFIIEDISRPTLLQVKYNISHEIFDVVNFKKVSLSDGLARRVDNYIRVTPDPDPTDNITNREYGPSSRTYTSGSTNSVQGPFYNGHTTYINLIPPANTTQDFTLEIWGRLCSNLDNAANGGDSLVTKLSFAVDFDFLFLKLH